MSSVDMIPLSRDHISLNFENSCCYNRSEVRIPCFCWQGSSVARRLPKNQSGIGNSASPPELVHGHFCVCVPWRLLAAAFEDENMVLFQACGGC